MGEKSWGCIFSFDSGTGTYFHIPEMMLGTLRITIRDGYGAQHDTC
jgi:hypothetical protein